MATVLLRRLSKHYRTTVALQETTLRIEDGEFFVLLGPSGSGKSTILRLIAGLEEATTGEIVVGSKLVNFVEPSRRNVAMVFQNYALYPHMTVFRNIAFPLEMARQRKEPIRVAVDAAASILGLRDLLGRYPDQLSGGQRQRVALARAIVREPQVFLMDEPLSNLDASLRVETREELLRLHKRLGTTFMYVTHDQLEAMTMGQRIVVLQEGAVQQVGTPNEVYNEPSNVFVAKFIGSPPMNLMAGALRVDSGDWRFQTDGFETTLEPGAVGADEDALRLIAIDGVRLGIRPEDLILGDPGKPGLKGQVQLVEPVGSDLYLRVQAANTILHVRTQPDVSISEGENVTLTLAPRRCHLFGSDGRNVRLAANR